MKVMIQIELAPNKVFSIIKLSDFFWLGKTEQMRNIVNHTKKSYRESRKVYNLRVEKIVREASDNFIYHRDYDTVLEQVNEALTTEPDNVKALVLKGDVLFSIEQKDESLGYFNKALEIDPYSVEAYGAKASALDILGMQKEALECCERAFSNISDNQKYLLPSLYDQKIAILIKLKRFEEAKKFLNASLINLSEEDGTYLFTRYQGAIESICMQRKKKREKLAKIALRLIN